MSNKLSIMAAAALVYLNSVTFPGIALGEQHTEDALKHADEAAHSIGDSQSIGEQAAEALKHIDAAKAAQAANPDAVKHLEQSETELNAAVTNARRFNSGTAAEDAEEAKRNLEQAEGVAETTNRNRAEQR